jgi:hypothetical protein
MGSKINEASGLTAGTAGGQEVARREVVSKYVHEASCAYSNAYCEDQWPGTARRSITARVSVSDSDSVLPDTGQVDDTGFEFLAPGMFTTSNVISTRPMNTLEAVTFDSDDDSTGFE